MKVLFASAEFAPIVRVGGLAEAASGLVRGLRAEGIDVELVLPDYRPDDVELDDEHIEELPVPAWVGWAGVRRGVHHEVGPITLVGAPDLARPGIYGDPDTGLPYHDNDRRFFHFSAAIRALIASTRPDVVHLNDWHTSPVVGMFSAQERPPCVLSIHNLAYQGWCDPGWTQVLHGDAHEPFLVGSSCVPLAGAVALADLVLAVSPTYAAEILTPAHGAGLDALLRARAATGAVRGIRNGIDAADWDPSTDAHLVRRYGVATLADKAANTAALREELALAPGRGPLLGMISRLVDQKGVDLVVGMAPYLDRIDAQLVVLGSGDRAIADSLYRAAADRPGRVAFVRGYDLAMSHRITAASDLYLMPSRFEPCGLAQMQAMAYGTIPVVSDVGGLHDTVVDADEDPTAGTGTRMVSNDLPGLVDALHRAVGLWRDPSRRRAAQLAGMSVDWSWAGPARQYIDAYLDAVRIRRG
jgi:starch synthase